MICKCFLLFYWLSFVDNAKVFKFDTTYLSFFFPFSCLYFQELILRNCHLIQGNKDLHLFFFLIAQLFCLIFDPLWTNFCMWYEARVQLHSFTCSYSVFPQSFVEKTTLSPYSLYIWGKIMIPKKKKSYRLFSLVKMKFNCNLSHDL